MNLSEYLMSHRVGVDLEDPCAYVEPSPRIGCRDGFSLSVQASSSTYCSPRRNQGPWFEVEVGFPSATPELIMQYCEDKSRPTDTVYGYVPIELVEQLIAMHGGSEALEGQSK